MQTWLWKFSMFARASPVRHIRLFSGRSHTRKANLDIWITRVETIYSIQKAHFRSSSNVCGVGKKEFSKKQRARRRWVTSHSLIHCRKEKRWAHKSVQFPRKFIRACNIPGCGAKTHRCFCWILREISISSGF